MTIIEFKRPEPVQPKPLPTHIGLIQNTITFLGIELLIPDRIKLVYPRKEKSRMKTFLLKLKTIEILKHIFAEWDALTDPDDIAVLEKDIESVLCFMTAPGGNYTFVFATDVKGVHYEFHLQLINGDIQLCNGYIDTNSLATLSVYGYCNEQSITVPEFLEHRPKEELPPFKNITEFKNASLLDRWFYLNHYTKFVVVRDEYNPPRSGVPRTTSNFCYTTNLSNVLGYEILAKADIPHTALYKLIYTALINADPEDPLSTTTILGIDDRMDEVPNLRCKIIDVSNHPNLGHYVKLPGVENLKVYQIIAADGANYLPGEPEYNEVMDQELRLI